MLICLLTHSIPLWLNGRDWPVAERPSALVLALSGVFFGGVILVFPLCACAPFAASYQTASSSKIVASSLWIKICSTALSGGLCATFPFVLHTLICNLVALPVKPHDYPNHELNFYGIYNNLYHVSGGLPMYLLFAFGMMLSGGAFALISLLVSLWIHRVQSIMAVPAIIYYLWIKLTLPNIPRPADIFSDALTHKDLFSSLIAFLILYFLLVAAFLFTQKGGVKADE